MSRKIFRLPNFFSVMMGIGGGVERGLPFMEQHGSFACFCCLQVDVLALVRVVGF
jgi:hypothetical protein